MSESSEARECVDDIAIIRSMWTDIPAHDVAQRFMILALSTSEAVGRFVGVYGLAQKIKTCRLHPLSGDQSAPASFLPGVYQGVT